LPEAAEPGSWPTRMDGSGEQGAKKSRPCGRLYLQADRA